MKRVLVAAVLVAFMPSANAQDKGKSDFSSNAEFRARYFYMQNPGASETTLSNASTAESRFKFGANYKANEKISAHLTLVSPITWGTDVNGQAGADTTATAGNEADNFLSVNEAYGTWMSSDDLNFRFGRMNFEIGDGALIGSNDWEAMPYAFEGLLANWEADFGKFQFVAFKVRNPNGTSASGDPQHNMYGVNFDLKTTPEWLKAVNAHVFKNNGDAIDPAVADTTVRNTTNGLDVIRYGAMGSFAFGPVDLKAWYETQGGKVKGITGGTKTELDYKGNMMQAEVGYRLHGFMASRFFLKWHKDSGDDNTTVGKETGTYDSYFNEKHNSAGAMDLFSWGNLTFTQVGWTFKPQDKTEVGLQYAMFKRTEASANSDTFNAGLYGGNLTAAAAASTDDKLGDELDVWATHRYDNSLSTTLRIGYFMPGDYFKNAPAKEDDKIMHVMVEGRATF